MAKKKNPGQSTASFSNCSAVCDKVPENDQATNKHDMPPIVVTMPDQIVQKMGAVCDLCSAIKSLARALESTNCNVHISDCCITCPPSSIGISIGPGYPIQSK